LVGVEDPQGLTAASGQILQEEYGGRRWSKMKGTAMVRVADGTIRRAEVHWYEAHGIGRKRMKIKRFLD
jgi:hypothetical protein